MNTLASNAAKMTAWRKANPLQWSAIRRKYFDTNRSHINARKRLLALRDAFVRAARKAGAKLTLGASASAEGITSEAPERHDRCPVDGSHTTPQIPPRRSAGRV